MAGITLTWAGGEHQFALSIGALRAVQKACEAGPGEILTRLQVGAWRVDDVMAVLRHGLEGGGMAKDEARDLVERAVESDGLMALVIAAHSVLASALLGERDDPVGEPEGVSPSQDSGGSASSMPPEPVLGSPPATSTP